MAVVAQAHVRDRPFARTIWTIAAKHFTGDLVMTEAGRTYRVTWQGGAVIAADSSAPADSLARIALTTGLVTSTQVGEIARVLAGAPERSQVDVLAEVAGLTAEQAVRVKRRSLAQSALRIFALADGSLVLDSVPSMARDAELSPLGARWLICQGLFAHYNEDRLATELSAVEGASFRLAAESRGALAQYGFAPALGECLRALDRAAMSADDLLAAVPDVSRKDVLALIYTLLATDALVVTGQGPRSGATVRPRPAGGNESSAPVAVARIHSRPVQAPVATRPPPVSAPSGVVTGSADVLQGQSRPIRMRRGSRPPSVGGGDDVAVPVETAAGRSRPIHIRASSQSGVEPGQDGVVAAPMDEGQSRSRPIRIRAATQPGYDRAPPLDPPPAAALPKPSEPDPQRVEESRELIAAKLREVDAGADHYALLGVARDAPAMAVRSAYFELAKNLHPDRLQALGITESPADAQRLFAAINQAFAVLGNAKKRAEYQKELEQGGAQGGAAQRDTEEYAARLVAAEQHFLRGEMAMRHNQIKTALAEFEKAAELNPDEAEHHALLAWAQWCSAADKNAVLAEVKKGFTRAITLSPKSVASYFYRGQVANSVGDTEGALECFRKVLRYQPEHREAGLQVRLIEGRMAKGGPDKPEKKGLLDRLKRR